MRSRFLYLLTGIAMLFLFIKCDNAPTATDNSDFEDLPKPELVAPTQNTQSEGNAVELSWEQIKDADKYRLQISESPDFSSFHIDSTVTGTSYTASSLKLETTYYWKVKAVKTVGKNGRDKVVGPWSDVWQFTTGSEETEVAKVELLSPDDGKTTSNTSLTFDWDSLSTSAEYHYQLSKDPEFSDFVKDTVTEVTSLEVSTLSKDQQYYWRVVPVLEDATTEWSEVYDFTVESEDSSTPKVTLASPSDGATELSTALSLEWEAISDISSYQVQLATNNDFSSPLVDQSVSGTSYSLSDLDNNQKYYWRVQAEGDGISTNWSDVYTFTTESIPEVTLISPSDGATDLSTSPTLEWESITEVSSYKVQMAASSDFSSPVVEQTVSNTSYEVTGLNHDQQYYWRVQATEDNEKDNWSNVRDLQTEPQSTDDNNTEGSVSGDRQALMDLYEATGGDSWANNSGWGSGDPSDSWYGVEVDANGRVVRLDLWENRLQGQLPASIGNLTKLTYLNVKQNQLTGTIPSEIGNMASLEWLILSGNSSFKEPPQELSSGYHPGKGDRATNDFSGSLPIEISNLSNLKRLELSGSSITNFPSWLGNITSLEGIYMNFNYEGWSGLTIPTSLSNLTNLGHLYLAANELSGEIPAGFSNLTNLTRLHLGEVSNNWPNNNLTGSLPDFSKFTKLQKINIQKNNLSGDWPSYWNNGNFGNLYEILAAWNDFTGTMHDFNNIPHIKQLAISGNNLSGDVSWLTTVDNSIKILTAGWNDFSGEFPQNWNDFGQLRLFRLNDTQVTGNISCDFWNSVDDSDKLKWIYLNDNELDSNATSCMESVSSPVLETIDVGGNNF